MNGFSKLFSIFDFRKTSLAFATCLLLCLSLSQVAAQTPTFCHTRGGSLVAQGSMPSPLGFNPPDPYYLRVYFHVVQRSNGSGGQTPAEVQGIFDLLNADFNPHNIFFVQDCAINFVQDDAIYADGYICDFSGYVHNDGIDIFLMADDANTQGGAANNIPSDYFLYPEVIGTLHLAQFLSPAFPPTKWGIAWACAYFPRGEPAGPFSDCDGGFLADPGVCLEFVNGSNGASCGDYVEDTLQTPI
jgi:hypothetical protein